MMNKKWISAAATACVLFLTLLSTAFAEETNTLYVLGDERVGYLISDGAWLDTDELYGNTNGDDIKMYANMPYGTLLLTMFNLGNPSNIQDRMHQFELTINSCANSMWDSSPGTEINVICTGELSNGVLFGGIEQHNVEAPADFSQMTMGFVMIDENCNAFFIKARGFSSITEEAEAQLEMVSETVVSFSPEAPQLP